MSDTTEAWLETLERRIDAAREEQKEQGADIKELRALVAQLVEILGKRGDLNAGHARLLDKIAKRARSQGKPKVKLSVIQDKYQVANADVDCAAIMPICKARCCTLDVYLAEQDVREGELEWEIDNPYALPRANDGYCIYLERGERAMRLLPDSAWPVPHLQLQERQADMGRFRKAHPHAGAQPHRAVGSYSRPRIDLSHNRGIAIKPNEFK